MLRECFMKNFYRKLTSGELSERHTFLILIIMGIWIYIPSLGIAELKSWDEAIYAAISRTIYISGDYLHLQFANAPYFNKPPLFFYLTSLGYHFFGINEFSARIVSVIFGLGCLALCFEFSRRLFHRKIAFISVLLLLSNYHFFKTVQHGRMESMVAFFILLACYSFYRLQENQKWIYGVAVGIGLGVLSKGAMGFLPFTVILPFMIIFPKWRRALCSIHTLVAIVIGLCIIFPWFYGQIKIYGANYINEAIGFQLMSRITSSIEGHREPWWYYLNISSLYYFSNWSLLVLPGLLFIAWKAITTKTPQLIFTALFAWIILLFFSFGIKTKLNWYIFTFYIPLSIAVAILVDSVSQRLYYLKHLVIITSLLSILIFPLLKFKVDHNSLKSLKPVFVKELNTKSIVYSYNMSFPALNYYTNANLKMLSSLEEVGRISSNSPVFVVLQKSDFARFSGRTKGVILAENGKYVFFKTVANT